MSQVTNSKPFRNHINQDALALWEDEGGLEEKNALDTTEFE
jgi:hypothetical protein